MGIRTTRRIFCVILEAARPMSLEDILVVSLLSYTLDLSTYFLVYAHIQETPFRAEAENRIRATLLSIVKRYRRSAETNSSLTIYWVMMQFNVVNVILKKDLSDESHDKLF